MRPRSSSRGSRAQSGAASPGKGAGQGPGFSPWLILPRVVLRFGGSMSVVGHDVTAYVVLASHKSPGL